MVVLGAFVVAARCAEGGSRVVDGQSAKAAPGDGIVGDASDGRLRRDGKAERHPGMVDVARVAGVSYQTVSRVVNNLPDVSPATRERVVAAISELGYRRNSAARALKTRRSATLGIISGGSARLGPVRTLVELESAARESGYGVTVVTVREPYAQSVPEAVGGLEELGVGGIIAIAPRIGLATAVRETRVRVPVVMIAAGEAGTPGIFTYSEDQERGARMATRHLLDLGHTDIAHLAGSMDWFDGRVRKRGWESEMRAAGLEPRTCLVGNWTPKWAYQTGLRFVAEGIPAAIFAASDHTALGLFRAFAEKGVKVPGDVSVVGFDDIEGADYFYPPLTTIRQNFPALARRSIDLLLRAGEGPDVDLAPIVPVLKIRSSTGPA
jgi:DNA-binding LacI/PurR family transcriptional regulator